jgi:hypothetical protein
LFLFSYNIQKNKMGNCCSTRFE